MVVSEFPDPLLELPPLELLPLLVLPLELNKELLLLPLLPELNKELLLPPVLPPVLPLGPVLMPLKEPPEPPIPPPEGAPPRPDQPDQAEPGAGHRACRRSLCCALRRRNGGRARHCAHNYRCKPAISA